MKITLPNKVKLAVTAFSHGSPEQFWSNVQTALETIRQKGLFVAYDKACKEDKEAEKTLVTTTVPAMLLGYG